MPENEKPIVLNDFARPGDEPIEKINKLAEIVDANAHILVSTSMVVQLLVKKLGLTNAEVNQYFQEAAKENATRIITGFEQAGTDSSDSRHGPELSPVADGRIVTRPSGEQQDRSIERTQVGDSDAPAGSSEIG